MSRSLTVTASLEEAVRRKNIKTEAKMGAVQQQAQALLGPPMAGGDRTRCLL